MKKLSLYSFLLVLVILTNACENNTKQTELLREASPNKIMIPLMGTEYNQDKEFIMQIGSGNTAEIKFGEMASTKSKNKDVKEFAKQMIKDHTEAQNELMKIAKAKNIQIADTLDAEHRKLKEKAMKLTGKEFDNEYIRSQVNDHQKVLKLFQNEIKYGKDKEVVAFAKKNVHHIEMHLEKAKELQGIVSQNIKIKR